jgi:TM2 domain-containing membrane protein YozV
MESSYRRGIKPNRPKDFGGVVKIAAMVILGLVITLICSATLIAQSATDDVIYLKNGSVIRGSIIEQIPNQTLKIQTKDGSVFVFKYNEIDKITKEQSAQVSRQSANYKTKKDPTLSFVLSFLIPGAGQVYNEQVTKGVIQFLGAAAGYTTFFIAKPHNAEVWVYDYYNYYGGYWEWQKKGNAGISWLGFFVGFGCHVWSMVDAPTTSNKINKEKGYSAIAIPLRKNLGLYISPTDFPKSNLGPNLKLTYTF